MNCVQGIEIFLAKFQTLQETLVKIKNFYLTAQLFFDLWKGLKFKVPHSNFVFWDSI